MTVPLADLSTSATVLLALGAGAIGSIVTALVAFGTRALRIGREIEASDRALRRLDDHLEAWVSDATVSLVRELEEIRADLAARGMFYSGAYGVGLARAKERALHAYRDQERTAQSQAADIRAREGWLHAFVRAYRYRSLDLELRAPERVLPILDRWASPPTRHLSPTDEPPQVEDPRNRSVESTLAFLDSDPDALT